MAARFRHRKCNRTLVTTWMSVLTGLLVSCGDDPPSAPTAPTVPANRAPRVTQAIPEQMGAVGETVELDIVVYFTDPDGGPLTYQVVSSNTHVATAVAVGSVITLTAQNLGTARITVTARDSGGLTATQAFDLTGVKPPNRAPEASRSIPDQTLKLDEDETARVNLDRYFTDPDGDGLTYEARSSNTHVATVSVSGSTVTIKAHHLGRADIRVTAQDGNALTVTQRFSATVEQGGPALEGEITVCRGTRQSGSSLVEVEIEGHVAAFRELSSVTVTGYANDSYVDMQDLGRISANSRKRFSLDGSIVTSASRLECTVRIDAEYRAARGPAMSAVTIGPARDTVR